MEKIIKEAWCNALRSNLYTQGQFKLQDYQGANCCLAILGKINGLSITSDGEEFTVDKDSKSWKNSTLPRYEALSQFGLDKEQQQVFIHMNDREQKTFEEIADYIEQNIN